MARIEEREIRKSIVKAGKKARRVAPFSSSTLVLAVGTYNVKAIYDAIIKANKAVLTSISLQVFKGTVALT